MSTLSEHCSLANKICNFKMSLWTDGNLSLLFSHFKEQSVNQLLSKTPHTYTALSYLSLSAAFTYKCQHICIFHLPITSLSLSSLNFTFVLYFFALFILTETMMKVIPSDMQFQACHFQSHRESSFH